MYEAHQGQKPYGTMPYFIHLLVVSELVKMFGGSLDQSIAALYHDFMEDVPNATPDDIVKDQNEHVMLFARYVTDDPRLTRTEQLIEQVSRASTMPREAALIKVCDVICHFMFWRTGPKSRKYWKKKYAIIDAIRVRGDGGAPDSLSRAVEYFNNFIKNPENDPLSYLIESPR